MTTPAIPSIPVKKNILAIPELERFFLIETPEPVEFINVLLKQAVKGFASDILFEPEEKFFKVRMRVDGVLYELGKINIKIYDRVVARLKVMSGLDVAEKRKVQEGQFSFDNNGETINFRLEIATTVHGELVVIRIHEKGTIVMDTANLGMSSEAYQNFQDILSQRSGMVLVCGPTGCGKTTTLYSTISKINQGGKYNVMTIEDPVEFDLDNTNQMQTQNEIGFNFAAGLKTILRLSPDIVLVGEIRDQETAEISVQTGLSGLMVLSTLHAEDSVGALFRLLDLGIEPYLLNSSLVGIVAQRLVRTICSECKEEYSPTENEIKIFEKATGRKPKSLFQGKGCQFCKNSGHKGRIGIFEVMPMTAEIRDYIRDKVSEHELRGRIFKKQSFTLIGDGMEKAEQGLTTIEEVLRSGLRMV
jgi:type IV pilus assembly protein PilB